ncbi:MAG: TMEM175 family protein [Opitutales bacterium]
MHKARLEAFSDGVLAIIITVMVLEMKVPHGTELHDLLPIWPVFLSYVLSFLYLGIYWNNHHHLFQAVKHVQGGVLWANLHLLFWLSLLPFVTGWMGENHFAPVTVSLYGGVLIMAAIAYFILVRALLAYHEPDSPLARAIGSDFKGKISVVIYAAGILAACWWPGVAITLYALVGLLWLVPDRRIEQNLGL